MKMYSFVTEIKALTGSIKTLPSGTVLDFKNLNDDVSIVMLSMEYQVSFKIVKQEDNVFTIEFAAVDYAHRLVKLAEDYFDMSYEEFAKLLVVR